MWLPISPSLRQSMVIRRRSFLALASLPVVSRRLAMFHPQNTREPREYLGTLEDELVPEFSFSRGVELSLNAAIGACLPVPLANDASEFDGKLQFSPGKEAISVVLVESPSGTYLYADLDHDGRFSSSEQFRFQPVLARPRAIGDVLLRVPLTTGQYRYFPIRVRLFSADSQPGGPSHPGTRTLFSSFWAYTTGTANVDGTRVRIWCEYDARTGIVDPHDGHLGIALERSGKLPEFPSSEISSAKNEVIVFQVGPRFLSIDRIDLRSRTFVLRSHAETDYRRIELRIGVPFPDFDFADFEAHKLKLSDFPNRYVLLDFWGSWCGPCIGEFRHLKSAYKDFWERGLEIIGVDSGDSFADAKKCIAEHALPWIQATSESTKDFVQERIRVTTYPTLILLDPQRRILSMGEGDFKLRGADLHDTLEKLLPRRDKVLERHH